MSSKSLSVLLTLILAILLPAAKVHAQEILAQRTIAPGEWVFNSGQVGDLSPIRAVNRGSFYSLQPSATQPQYSLGWIQGPTVRVDPAAANTTGNNAVLRVRFSFTRGSYGVAPELRLRMNSADFGTAALGNVSQNRFLQLTNNSGTVTAILDRSQLVAATDVLLFIDLISVQPTNPGVDPAWEIRIDSAEFFTTTASNTSNGYPADKQITAAYVEVDGDVSAYFGTSRARTRIFDARNLDGVSFAFDGPFAVIIEDGALHAYNGLTNTVRRLDTDNVVSAGISGPHVVFVESDQDVKYYNVETNSSIRRLAQNREYGLAVGASNGVIMVIERGGDGRPNIFRYDAKVGGDSLERVDDDDEALFIKSRSTGSFRSGFNVFN